MCVLLFLEAASCHLWPSSFRVSPSPTFPYTLWRFIIAKICTMQWQNTTCLSTLPSILLPPIMQGRPLTNDWSPPGRETRSRMILLNHHAQTPTHVLLCPHQAGKPAQVWPCCPLCMDSHPRVTLPPSKHESPPTCYPAAHHAGTPAHPHWATNGASSHIHTKHIWPDLQISGEPSIYLKISGTHHTISLTALVPLVHHKILFLTYPFVLYAFIFIVFCVF